MDFFYWCKIPKKGAIVNERNEHGRDNGLAGTPTIGLSVLEAGVLVFSASIAIIKSKSGISRLFLLCPKQTVKRSLESERHCLARGIIHCSSMKGNHKGLPLRMPVLQRDARFCVATISFLLCPKQTVKRVRKTGVGKTER